MENYLSENEEYKVEGICRECHKRFFIKALKKDVDLGNIKCSLCDGINLEIFSSKPVREVLME